MIKDKPHAIDKWPKKRSIGQNARSVGPLGGRPADLAVGPTAFRFHVEVSYWLVMAV